MPPRRTSLQVDVSRDLYIVCAFMYQGMPHQQAQAFTVAHNPQKALADCGFLIQPYICVEVPWSYFYLFFMFFVEFPI